MDLQALIAKKNSLEKELDEICDEIVKLKKTIREGKIRKVCELLEELWKETETIFEIRNHAGEYIDIDFEDLCNSLAEEFGI